jgi:hypothetical protein
MILVSCMQILLLIHRIGEDTLRSVDFDINKFYMVVGQAIRRRRTSPTTAEQIPARLRRCVILIAYSQLTIEKIIQNETEYPKTH